jgi:hypothetical protein
MFRVKSMTSELSVKFLKLFGTNLRGPKLSLSDSGILNQSRHTVVVIFCLLFLSNISLVPTKPFPILPRPEKH